MKKYVIITLVLILVPLYAFDVYLHNWTKSQFYHTMQAAFPQASNIQISIGDHIYQRGEHKVAPTPMLPPLVLSHTIPQVSIKIVRGTNLSSIPVDYWAFTADSVSFDSSQLFNSKRVVAKDVTNGDIHMSISARSLSNLSPQHPVEIDSADNATAYINGQNVPLTVSTNNEAIIFTTNTGTEFGRIPTHNPRLLPCKPQAKFVARALLLSCKTQNVPGALKLS